MEIILAVLLTIVLSVIFFALIVFVVIAKFVKLAGFTIGGLLGAGIATLIYGPTKPKVKVAP